MSMLNILYQNPEIKVSDVIGKITSNEAEKAEAVSSQPSQPSRNAFTLEDIDI
jgi:hypothetical protein